MMLAFTVLCASLVVASRAAPGTSVTADESQKGQETRVSFPTSCACEVDCDGLDH